MMAPSIIYCAPIPFNIVFHNANKGKMRINVLDLSRFCYTLGRERTTPGNSLALLRSFPITTVTTTKMPRRGGYAALQVRRERKIFLQMYTTVIMIVSLSNIFTSISHCTFIN